MVAPGPVASSPRRAGLRVKLLASYLAVVLLAAAVLVATVELSAPLFYRQHIEQLSRALRDSPPDLTRAELESGYSRAFAGALVVAGLVTLPFALLTSAWVSRRIVRPVQGVIRSSARIAAGHYDERLPVAGDDELGELTRHFNTMAAALDENEARRRELIGTVAHELRTPLSGLRGYAEGMLDGVFSLERGSVAIIREVGRLERLVDDLSTLSQAEAGALPIRLRPVALEALANEVCARFMPGFTERRLSLEVEARERLTVRADEDRLTQVLTNLLANALRHTREGGVRVRVLARGGEGLLEVADTGEGIQPSDLPHVFERFYRADKSRSRGEGGEVGVGVGLTISRHLVEAMGGRIWAESDPERRGGATFTVALPLASSPARAGTPALERTPPLREV